MKIKVVDMPYEQALAQPREKHTPPRRPSMLFRALLRALSAPDLRATHFRCDRVGMERLGPDEPCLVLMNHSCFLDLKITAAVLYPRPFNIVCTSDGFVGKAGLMRALGCIPTRKFQPDTALVRDMLYAVKKLKSSILLYPEASYSFDGTATPLPESLGKCVKALGVPIVLLRTCGAFARDPLYNGLQNRRVDVSAELRYLLSPEEAAEKSTDELCGREPAALCGEVPATAFAGDAAEREAFAEEIRRIAKQNRSLRYVVGILVLICGVLTMLSGYRSLQNSKAPSNEITTPAPLPDTITISGLTLDIDGIALVFRFVPSVSGEGYEWSASCAPDNNGLISVETTTDGGICTVRLLNVPRYGGVTLSATVTNGAESRSICLATDIHAGENSISWDPQV